MITYRCYKEKELLDALGNEFRVINSKVQEEIDEDVMVDTNKFYITNKNNVTEVLEYSGWWLTTVVCFDDGTKIKLYSDNINSDEKDRIRIRRNNFFSPPFKKQDGFILANEDLDIWLEFNGVSRKYQEKISTYFNLYSTYVYEGINAPIIRDGKLCGGYSTPLKIAENEIDAALADIKNDEMRIKFEHVLKAKIFKRVLE